MSSCVLHNRSGLHIQELFAKNTTTNTGTFIPYGTISILFVRRKQHGGIIHEYVTREINRSMQTHYGRLFRTHGLPQTVIFTNVRDRIKFARVKDEPILQLSDFFAYSILIRARTQGKNKTGGSLYLINITTLITQRLHAWKLLYVKMAVPRMQCIRCVLYKTRNRNQYVILSYKYSAAPLQKNRACGILKKIRASDSVWSSSPILHCCAIPLSA